MAEQTKIIPNDIQLLTRHDLVSLLKRGISSIDKIPESELPRVHMGKSIRFKVESVQSYINKCESKKGKND